MLRFASPILLALSVLSFPAAAQKDSVRREEAEARLLSCEALTGDDRQWCEMARKRFPEDYAKAWQGDYQAQRNVAYMLGRQSYGAVRVDPIEGCAWRWVISTSGHPSAGTGDTSNLQMECGKLSQTEQQIARARADRIMAGIHR